MFAYRTTAGMMDEEELYEYYEDGDDILEGGYTEKELYEQYSPASATRYLMPQEQLSFGDQFRQCVELLMVVKGENGLTLFGQLGLLLGSCLLILLTSCQTFLPRYVVPLTSLLCGSFVIYAFFGNDSQSLYLIYGFATVVYIFTYYFHNVLRKDGVGWRVGCLCFMLIIIVQTFISDKTFLRIRGIFMIMTMKLLSLASDIDANVIQRIPGIIDYYSYCIGISSVMFGPWIPYREHAHIMKRKNNKGIWKTIRQGIYTFVIALICFLLSSCFLEWFIPDDYEAYSAWIVAFRDAMSFRCGHYFVSYAAEGSLYLSGYLATSIDDEEDENESEGQSSGTLRSSRTRSGGRDTAQTFGRQIVRAFGEADEEYPVTNPLYIELPRSLVDVVVNWNIPMHLWLKKYVFTPVKDEAGYFWAVVLTYLCSSVLHGFNFQVSAVLLSLGFYTYAEHVLREKLAKAFNACIRARRCRPGCDHLYHSWNLYVIMVNFLFFALALFHLTYLGMVFDSSEVQEEGYSMTHALRKWSQLNYASHFIALVVFVFAILI